MAFHLAHVALLVHEYDEAIAFYTKSLGFTLIADETLGQNKRWVLVGPTGGSLPSILLARATTPAQRACVGNQTGGRVFLFLHTDDIRRDRAAMEARGVQFLEPLRDEPYGTVAVFVDLYGNKWDLVQPLPASQTAAGR
jgi:catechol 2,3-dioxygenase-like lactoylglutathione lyase family enzyme